MFDTRRDMFKSYVRKTVMGHIKTAVKDQDTAAKLTPSYDMGCKRITPSDTYLQVSFLPF